MLGLVFRHNSSGECRTTKSWCVRMRVVNTFYFFFLQLNPKPIATPFPKWNSIRSRRCSLSLMACSRSCNCCSFRFSSFTATSEYCSLSGTHGLKHLLSKFCFCSSVTTSSIKGCCRISSTEGRQ